MTRFAAAAFALAWALVACAESSDLTGRLRGDGPDAGPDVVVVDPDEDPAPGDAGIDGADDAVADANVATIDPPAADCPLIEIVGTDGLVLNIRPSPDTSGEAIGSLAPYSVVEVEGVTRGEMIETTNVWYAIDHQGVLGFVSGRFTECRTEIPEGSCGEGPISRYTFPVPNYTSISQRYGGGGTVDFCGIHVGVDIAARRGSPIVSIADGLVVYIGPMWANAYQSCGQANYRGPYAIIIQHEPGHYSTYSHNGAPYVQEGDCVRVGQPIAPVDTLGNSTGPHLHLEVIEGVSFTGACNPFPLPSCGGGIYFRDPFEYIQDQ